MPLAIEMYETGVQVYEQKMTIEGSYEQSIDMTSLASGIYTVLLRLPNGFLINEQIVKAK